MVIGFKKSNQRRQQGDARRDERDWQGAVEHYTAHLESSPDDVDIWVQLGHAHKEIGQLDAAQRAYFRALSIGPPSADIYVQIGHVEKLYGRAESAYHWYQRALDIDGAFEPALLEFRNRGSHRTNPIAQADVGPPSAGVGAMMSRIEAAERRLGNVDDLGHAMRALGGEMQRIRGIIDAQEVRLKQLAASNDSLQQQVKASLVEQSSRLAELEKTPATTRNHLASLLTQYHAVSDLEGELKALRTAVTELQRQIRDSGRSAP